MKLPPPSTLATFERAYRLSNIAIHAVALQVRRLRSTEPEDATFILRKWSDFDYLIVSLTRLRRSVQLACELPDVKAELESALNAFDRRLPGLKQVRDTAEHIDEYSRDQGRNKSISRTALESSLLSSRGPTLNWLGARMNATIALRTAECLFLALQNSKNALNHRDP